MKTVKLVHCKYELFEQIKDLIFEFIPFGITYAGYSPKSNIAVFNFWDTDYIPQALMCFVQPFNQELMKLFDDKAKEINFHP